MLRRTVVCLVGGAVVTIAIAWTAAHIDPCQLGRQRSGYAVSDRRLWRLHEYPGSAGSVITWESASGLELMKGPGPDGAEFPEEELEFWVHLEKNEIGSGISYGKPRRGVDSNVRSRIVEMRGWPFPALYGTLTQDESRMEEYRTAEARASAASLPPQTPSPAGSFHVIRPTNTTGNSPPLTIRDAATHAKAKRPFSTSGCFVSLLPGRAKSLANGAIVVPYHPMLRGFVLDTLIFGAMIFVPIAVAPLARYWWRRRSGRCPECGYSLESLPIQGCPECGWHRADKPATSNQS